MTTANAQLGTADWRRIDAAHHLHPFTDTKQLNREGTRVITHGEGVWLHDSDGNRILAVSETEIAAAMRTYFECTHSVAEGAGAAPLAALLQEREAMAGRKVAVVLSGGNIDTAWYRTVLAGGVPAA